MQVVRTQSPTSNRQSTINMKLHFSQFKVYKDTKKLITDIFKITRRFENGYWSLQDQINRSVISIALNIAEGSAKSSDRDFNRYILNALGSATELSAAIDIAKDLKIISASDYEHLSENIIQIIKQLGGFSKYLKNN